MTKKNDRKHISRVKTGKTNGWQVRMMRENIKHSKFFSVKRFGGVAKALEAAKKYRNSLVKLAPPSRQNAVDLSPNAGICLETCGSYKAWVASWVDETGTRRRKKFNVRKHGNLKAKMLSLIHI